MSNAINEELEAEEKEASEKLEEADKAETFNEFCECFNGCEYCPFKEIHGVCEDLWEHRKNEMG